MQKFLPWRNTGRQTPGVSGWQLSLEALHLVWFERVLGFCVEAEYLKAIKYYDSFLHDFRPLGNLLQACNSEVVPAKFAAVHKDCMATYFCVNKLKSCCFMLVVVGDPAERPWKPACDSRNSNP